MERKPHGDTDPVGFYIGDTWITRSISKVLRFEQDPLCDHLEVNNGGEYPMAYVMDEESFQALEASGWCIHAYEAASPQLKEFIVEIHLDNLDREIERFLLAE